MQTLAIVAIFGQAFYTIREFVFMRMKRLMTQNIHKETLRYVLKATVNTFFDVTPIGKILNIFSSKMDVFSQILGSLWHTMNVTTHILVVLYYLFAIGNWGIVATCLYFMYLTIIKVGAPWMISD